MCFFRTSKTHDHTTTSLNWFAWSFSYTTERCRVRLEWDFCLKARSRLSVDRAHIWAHWKNHTVRVSAWEIFPYVIQQQPNEMSISSLYRSDLPYVTKLLLQTLPVNTRNHRLNFVMVQFWLACWRPIIDLKWKEVDQFVSVNECHGRQEEHE